jgi:DNA-binding transcriptional LysR family regulator
LLLLEDRERTVQELRDLLGLRRGTLRIAASTVPGTYHLPPVIKRFMTSYPETRFEVSIAGSEQVIDWVADGERELGIAGDPGESLIGQAFQGKSALCAVAKLWKDDFVLAVPADHPFRERSRVSIGELLEVPFVMREPGSGTRRWLELYLQEALSDGFPNLRVAAEMGSLGAIKQAVIHGLGVSLVSLRSVQAELDAGLLHAVEIEDHSFNRWFYLFRDQRRTPSPLARMFTELILEMPGIVDLDDCADAKGTLDKREPAL